jgi:PTS system mannose-specific IIA component
MPGLLIIAHAPLASALRSVAAHVYPDELIHLVALDVEAHCPPEQLEQQARAALALVADPQALILTDVFGATPCNVAQRLVDGADVRLVTGVNVPMLWRALCYIHEPVDQLVARTVAGGAQGVMQVVSPRPQNQTQFNRSHDQSHAHHQQ